MSLGATNEQAARLGTHHAPDSIVCFMVEVIVL